MQQILRGDIFVAISPPPLRFLSVLNGLCRADMEAAEAFHAAMLPHGMAGGAQDVLRRADALA